MAGRIDRGDHINWNQVFYFSQIAATGSVKAASEKLGLSSSTLSEHLSQLEADLNIKLFQRQHRRLQLTSEGARLFQYAKQMFETGKRFIDVISPTSLGCYPVSIGLIPGPSITFANKIINKYISAYKDISINVLRYQHEQLEAALLEARIDFGFTDRKSDRKDIIQCQVVASELGLFVSQRLPEMALTEYLKTIPLVVCRPDRSGPSAMEELLDSFDLMPRNIVASEYPSLVEYLCREGSGVAVMGRAHFSGDETIRMLHLPKEFPSLNERLYVTWAADSENAEAVKRLQPFIF